MTQNKHTLTLQQQIQESAYYFPYHYLDLGSEEFRYIWNLEYLEKIQTVIQKLKLLENHSILDIGCGDGRLIYNAKQYTPKITGTDYSPNALQFAKAFNPDQIFINADIIQAIPVNQKFDRITCLDVLEHIPIKSQSMAIKNITTMIKPNGICIITVPSINLPLAAKHYCHFSKSTLITLLTPFFQQVEIFGYQSVKKQNQFILMRNIGLIIYPYRKQIKWVYTYLNHLQQWFHHEYCCDPNNSFGLIAVCKN